MKALTKKQQQDIRDEWVTYWEASKEDTEQYDVLFFEDEQNGYEGSAWGLLREKSTGKLFEISGSHCSCHGYEGQWSPTPTSVVYLTSEHFAPLLYMEKEARVRWDEVVAGLKQSEEE